MRIVFILIIQILLVLPTYALEFNQLYDTDTTNNGTAEQISRYQGKLVAYWTRIGSNPKDKAIAFIFYPKQTHYKYIDLAIKQYGYGQWGLFKVTEPHNKFTREERAENNLQLAKKYFGTLPKSFLKSQEGVLVREGGGNNHCNVYDYGANYNDFNLYEKPSSTATIINKLPPATPLITINRTANSDWLAVEALVDKQKVKGFVLAKQVTFNRMGVVDNNEPVMLYVQPEEKANVMATLTDDNIKLTTIKSTANKDWLYVEILEHEPIYKGYLKRKAIEFN